MKFSKLKSLMIILAVGTTMAISTDNVKADTMFSTTGIAGFSLEVDNIVTAEKATMVDETEEENNDQENLTIDDNIVIAKVVKYLNIRQKPSEDAEVVGKLYKGAVGMVLKEVEDGWTKIESGTVTGWVNNDYIVRGKKAQSYANKVCKKKARVITDTLRVREKPNTDSTIVTLIGANEEMQIIKEKGDWLAVKIDEDLKGYVSKEYVKIEFDFDYATSLEEERLKELREIRIQEENAANQEEIVQNEQQNSVQENSQKSEEKQNTNDNNKSSNSEKQTSSSRQKIVDYAVQFVGNPYVYGGTSLTNGTDCSGFTQGIYRHFGVSINRTSREQANNGRSVSLDNVKPGDLIFYKNGSTIGHVALYIGDGKVVHASCERVGITISNMYYRTPYCARNVYD